MAVMNFEQNALYGDNGTGKLFLCTNYEGATYAHGDGTNETAALATLDALTYADIGFFENFEVSLKSGETKSISTDYCEQGEISSKTERVPGFKVDVQEILEMNNLATILGYNLNNGTDAKIIGMKRKMGTNPYHLFKFVTCPKKGKSNTFYFVKASLSGDITMPFTNLKRSDFAGVTLEFEVAEGGNFFIKKEI